MNVFKYCVVTPQLTVLTYGLYFVLKTNDTKTRRRQLIYLDQFIHVYNILFSFLIN